ncbi:hypothetical protein RvY_11917 [Ramazzottius varieornatus]|uniref:Uncharacterized protein n=1 Tax=Ramazzottius varieornatus TaxID=947166 RepID=A0A1D1VHP1_RAMVA|nr:hypothetical protein RvY_11917 [Ramazzottius varieornatus]
MALLPSEDTPSTLKWIVFGLLVAKMKGFLRRANKIALAADIGTKKAMTESFLGMTARFYDPETKAMHSMKIACRSFPLHIRRLECTS